jgi:hypothetical protein
MSAGLVPVIHRSGGPWEDILDKTQGIYGYSYAYIDEAIDIIEKLLHSNTALEVSKRARDRLLHLVKRGSVAVFIRQSQTS